MRITPLTLIAGVVAITAASVFFIRASLFDAPGDIMPPVPTSFDECVTLGNPVMESYPRQCRSVDGTLFVEEIAEEPISTSSRPVTGSGDYEDRIRIESPKPGSVISTPLGIRGEARGTWYFEASFPIILTDWDGRIIAETYAQAKGEWMTEEYVPFAGIMMFTKPYDDTSDVPDFMKWGTLILKRDNPSGLPEHDAAIEIPVRFDE